MLGWGPTFGNVSLRSLSARERADLGQRGRKHRACVVLLAVHSPRDPSGGCFGGAALPAYPNFCVQNNSTWVCALNDFGAYECPTHADEASLGARNATTDKRGFLKLDVPLRGTRATPPLAWQRRYPHTDGWIEPWARSGMLLRGLRLDLKIDRGGGTCSRGSEETVVKSALRCVWRGRAQIDPCFPQHPDWNHRGAVVACATSPGSTIFGRFVIVKRS